MWVLDRIGTHVVCDNFVLRPLYVGTSVPLHSSCLHFPIAEQGRIVKVVCSDHDDDVAIIELLAYPESKVRMPVTKITPHLLPTRTWVLENDSIDG